MAADRDWRWIAWAILGIGGLILAGGLALGLGTLRHVLYGERADGEVIEMRREGDMYAPVVRFRLPGGETQEVKDLASGAPDFAVGDKVAILYMPQDSRDFRIDTFDRLWSSAIFVTVFGGFWILFGTVAWALSRGIDLAMVGEQAFAAIAVVAGLIGVFVLWSAADLYTGGVRAEGLVVEVRESRRAESESVRRADGREVDRTVERIAFAPVVRFTTRKDGREIEFHGRGGSDRAFAKGERVTVIYDPANPIRARIVSFADIWLPSAAAFAVAAVFGGAVWLSRRIRRRATGLRA
ncbi:MAG: DUF3592 domain-containing protein [Rhodospirillales bacterium]|nr:DUF3592 domain-containing protein [Rhodospirillales bacterium]